MKTIEEIMSGQQDAIDSVRKLTRGCLDSDLVDVFDSCDPSAVHVESLLSIQLIRSNKALVDALNRQPAK